MDKISVANTLRCLQIWADHNEGMVGIDVIPPAPAWEALSKEQREDVINLNSRFHKDNEPIYWDGDTTSDWVANELKKLGIDSSYKSERTDMFSQRLNESVDDKILYIIRGIPGSGKSTLANKLTSNVVEADQFMYEDGEYKWKPEKLHMAHQKCQETVEQYMQEGRDKIAVANTFIKLKEIKPYIDLAKQYDYKIVVKECDGGFQSVHNVPEETLEKMRNKFQPYKDEVMNESKQLTESILYDDLAYNDWNEKYEQLTVIANPSIEWLRNQLNSDDCYGFRFLHNTEKNILYVWDCRQPWMHQQVFDIVDMDWGKPGTNVIGILEPDGVIAVWEELADDGEASSSIELAKKLDGKFFKELYPNGYQITTCC